MRSPSIDPPDCKSTARRIEHRLVSHCRGSDQSRHFCHTAALQGANSATLQQQKREVISKRSDPLLKSIDEAIECVIERI